FPIRYKVRAPSYTNIFSNEAACVGQTVADAALVLAAVDPCYCCTERMVVLDCGKGGNRSLKPSDLLRLSHERTELIRKDLGLV
ncbi:NADH:ubiquinone oxidoreductase, partial [bacterium]|nr:NADH:ubiquinone oxidoreductase [bacterium]